MSLLAPSPLAGPGHGVGWRCRLARLAAGGIARPREPPTGRRLRRRAAPAARLDAERALTLGQLARERIHARVRGAARLLRTPHRRLRGRAAAALGLELGLCGSRGGVRIRGRGGHRRLRGARALQAARAAVA